MSRHRTTRFLRRLGDATVGRRRLARALFKASGYLSRIKTYQRFYTWTGDADSFADAKASGRHWTSCALSSRLMGQSMQLDWDHWEHWACIHDDCKAPRCAECGGLACDPEFDDEQERAS